MQTEINYKQVLEHAIDAAWVKRAQEHIYGDVTLPTSAVGEVVNMLVGSNGELTLEDAVLEVYNRDILDWDCE